MSLRAMRPPNVSAWEVNVLARPSQAAIVAMWKAVSVSRCTFTCSTIAPGSRCTVVTALVSAAPGPRPA